MKVAPFTGAIAGRAPGADLARGADHSLRGMMIVLALLMGLAGCSTMATSSVRSSDQVSGVRAESATSVAGTHTLGQATGADNAQAAAGRLAPPTAGTVPADTSGAPATDAASVSAAVPGSTAGSALTSASEHVPLSPDTAASAGIAASPAASDVAPSAPVLDSGPVPRVEPPHPGSNRPYVVRGQQIVPLASITEHRERGVASWYGHPFHGRATASGERFDMHALSAAHKTLPIPSYLRVTHVRSGRSVVVRVNDRGPFASDRVLDLSYAAAQRLGFAQHGTAEVQIELLASPRGFSQAMLAARSAAASQLAQSSRPPQAGASITVALDEVRATPQQQGVMAGDGAVPDDPKADP